ncbi:MAG: TonB family protein [Candidatus Omnitrophota bacterium]
MSPSLPAGRQACGADGRVVPAAETVRDLWRKETDASGENDKGDGREAEIWYNSPMSSSCGFSRCLLLSAALHVMGLAVIVPHVVKPLAIKKPLVVSYERTAEEKVAFPSPEYAKTDKPQNKFPQIHTEEKLPVFQDFSKNEVWNKQARKSPWQGEGPELSLPSESTKTPEYKNYERLLHEKIRKYAYYHYYRYFKKPLGEVVCTFTLSSAGELLEASIDERKSSNAEVLRTIALKSVRAAAPYPPFEGAMKQLNKQTFNVRFIFELKRIDTSSVQ